jgi:Dolichyl-phosphate-mannose-protein mannosyltransferase
LTAHWRRRTLTLQPPDGERSLSSAIASTQAAADATARTGWRTPALTWVDVAFVLALAGVTVALRATRLPAPSLWFDDAYVGLVTKADTFEEIRLVGLTSPGYAFLLKGWLTLFGFTELNAQLPALLLGVATPPLVYGLLVWRDVQRLAAGMGALLLAVSEVHIQYSDRVKQFTLDGVVSLGLIAVFWWLLDDVRSARRWSAAGLASVGAGLLSTPSFILVTAGFGVSFGLLLVRHRSAYRAALLPTAVTGVFGLVWLVLVVRPAINAPLHDFWGSYYISLDGPTAAFGDAGLLLQRLIERAVALPTGAAVLLVVLATSVVLLRRPVLGLFLVTPVLIAVVLAAAELAPLGGGRIDVYLYPGLAVIVALALDEVAGISRLALAAICAALVGLFAVSYTPADVYPQQDLEPLVAHVQREASPSDGILVYPHASFGFGLYTTWPVDLEPSETWATGFDVRVGRPNVYTPTNLSRTPLAARAAVREATRLHDRVWFVVEQETSESIRMYRDAFRSLGYSKSRELRRPGASLTLWTRK